VSRFSGPQPGMRVRRPNGTLMPKGVLRTFKAERSKKAMAKLEESRLREAKLSAEACRTIGREPHDWITHPSGKLEIICANPECTAFWKPNRPAPPDTQCPQPAVKSEPTQEKQTPKRDKRIKKDVELPGKKRHYGKPQKVG
jgi:hypothetical protein